jgi:hypothetical protein
MVCEGMIRLNAVPRLRDYISSCLSCWEKRRRQGEYDLGGPRLSRSS